MFDFARDRLHAFLGRGEATVTVPTFDGALKPNQALEGADLAFECEAPEDLATDGTSVFLADGPRLCRIEDGAAVELRRFDRPLTAIACLPGGGLAVALGGTEVQVFDTPEAARPSRTFAGAGMHAVNALAPAGDGALHATDGSGTRGAEQWVWDLMERGRTGRVLRLDLESGDAKVVAQGLQYAFGVSDMGGEALVSESWRHRLVAVGRDGGTRRVLSQLPVYPSRLSPAPGGGWWLAAFAARTQLVEFVLREPAFRKRMLAEIAPEYWIAPRLRSGASFKEPMQGAHLKTMGVVKPWAPPRSYGLVIRLDAEARPMFSLHSRVDGSQHGVVAAVECGGRLWMIAKGPKRVLSLATEGLAQEFVA